MDMRALPQRAPWIVHEIQLFLRSQARRANSLLQTKEQERSLIAQLVAKLLKNPLPVGELEGSAALLVIELCCTNEERDSS